MAGIERSESPMDKADHKPSTVELPDITGKLVSVPRECRAIVVNEANEEDILHGVKERGSTIMDSIPVQVVTLPVEDISTVAVISWRWDSDLKERGSRNIAAAVRHAKAKNIKHLFIDIVSIDQNQQPDSLVEQVMAFAGLYSTIPVIVAYDDLAARHRYPADDDKALCPQCLYYTIHRPWLVYEQRLFRYNPTKIVYVGHNNQGLRCYPEQKDGTEFDPKLMRYAFYRHMTWIWGYAPRAFCGTITAVLCGEIGMACISDFRYILPSLARVLTEAYELMSRNDYLLTAFVLSTGLLEENMRDIGINFTQNIPCLDYVRYSFAKVDSTDPEETDVRDIYLDGIRIGCWKEYSTNVNHGHKLIVYLHAKHTILTVLGLPWSDDSSNNVFLDHDNAPLPVIELAPIEL